MTDSMQSKGGKARARSLSTEERSAIAKQAALARWEKLKDPSRLPEASHQGILEIGEIPLDVYVLEDGRRLLHKKAIANALGLRSEGGNAFIRTITREGIRSVIKQELAEKIENPIVFKPLNGDSADGFEANTFIEVCDLLIEAFNQDKLHPSQHFLARQAEIIIRSAAKVGINALVDEATGYIHDKRKDEYRQLFKEFIEQDCRQWAKEFPDQFANMIYRLYGLKRLNPDSTRHPQFFGHFTRKYVYFPLANSRGAILEQLEDKNPVVYASGGRKFRLHQFLTEEIGIPALRQHIWQVIGIGNSSNSKEGFERAFYRAFPEAVPIGSKYGQFDLFSDLTDHA